MDFIDRVKGLADRIEKQKEYCQTEEATKNALIMPFIAALGYDVFNPLEVVPEFTADVGIKKGEKVDYAIFQDEKPIILFECKKAESDLNQEHASQLHRYFHVVPDVRFGVLTNGIQYQFYSDLEALNRMDEKPFFEFDMLNFQDRSVSELKKFTKTLFNLDDILTTANELKYTAAIEKIITQEFDSPSEGFVKFFTSQVYSGRMTQSVREQFTELTAKAIKRFLNNRINERLRSAMEGAELHSTTSHQEHILEDVANGESSMDETEDSNKKGIITTEEEIEGFFAIKAILRETLDVKRVHMRDTKSYCGILLDDNNRKPIVRLRFNSSQLYIGLIDNEKNEQRIAIDEIDDIYKHANAIIETVAGYEFV